MRALRPHAAAILSAGLLVAVSLLGACQRDASTTSAAGAAGAAAGTGSSTGGTGGSVSAACATPAAVAQRWAQMDTEPIRLPGQAAGLNLAPSLTLAQAELIDCKGMDEGDEWGDGSNTVAWGDEQEATFRYMPATGIGNLIQVWTTYTGTLTFESPDGADTYVMQLHRQVLKNGAPFPLGAGQQVSEAAIDELNRAMTATFTSDALDPPGTTCVESGKCSFPPPTSVGTITFLPVALIVWLDLPACVLDGAL